MRIGRRESLLRVLAVGVVIVLAACTDEGRDTKGPPRSTTAPSTTVAPTTTTPPVTYQVKRGDTLTSIGRMFGVSTAAIVAANQLGNADRLTEGQVLQIPPVPPATLTITPPDAIAGTVFTFTLISAKAGEVVVFEIQSPDGGKFTGSPHTASQDGNVGTTYLSSGDSPGTYTVVATGDRGTSVQATYRLLG